MSSQSINELGLNGGIIPSLGDGAATIPIRTDFTLDYDGDVKPSDSEIPDGKDDDRETKREKLVSSFFDMYKYKGKNKKKKDSKTLYEYMTGRRLLSKDQVLYDDEFEKTTSLSEDKLREFVSISTFIQEAEVGFDTSKLPDTYLPLISPSDKNKADALLKGYDNCEVLTDEDGYFVINSNTNNRTKSYKDITDIPINDYNNILKESNIISKELINSINIEHNRAIVTDDNEDDLENSFEKYKSLNVDNKLKSDDISIRIYGDTNPKRYEELKHKYNLTPLKSDEISSLIESGFLLNDFSKNLARSFNININNFDYAIKQIDTWSKNAGIFYINRCDNEMELEKVKDRFNSQDKILRRYSDNMMIRFLGCTNDRFYEFQSAVFNKKPLDTNSLPLIESVELEESNDYNNHILSIDLPFYTPYEIEDFRKYKTLSKDTIISKEKIDKWINGYNKIFNEESFDRNLLIEWVRNIRYLNNLNHNDPDNLDVKQTMLELGWNPYLEFNCINRTHAINRINSIKKEYYISDKILSEAKDFPIEFDNYGNLLITKPENIDFDKEYFESHILIMSYNKTDNLDGIKFELCRLWYLNSMIERIIYSQNPTQNELKELNKSRARILNDFNTYLNLVNKKDKHFNFNNYFNRTKFNNKQIRIKGSTLKYTASYLKKLLYNIFL